ncbi:hypothetical protein C8R42DRAFT_716167 [Lentinula raphanica]|nr:hypothetical protein C8R42DRAFT_716167 [Lentinula raphanica]
MSMQQRFVFLSPTGGSLHTTMQWRRSGGNGPHLPISIQANTNSQARIILDNLQPFVAQNANASSAQFASAILHSNELSTTEAALIQDEGLGQGTRIWWHARNKLSYSREAFQSVDNSRAAFRRAFGFGSFREALYSAISFDANPAGLLYNYNPTFQPADAATIRASVYPHGILSTTLHTPAPTAPAPASPAPSTAAPSNAAPPAASTASTAAPPSTVAAAGATVATNNPGPTPSAALNMPSSPSAAVSASNTPQSSPAPTLILNRLAAASASQRASASPAPCPYTPDRGFDTGSLHTPVPTASGGVVIYLPSVNISYGESPTKQKPKGKGKGRDHAEETSGSDWVRHYLFCQEWDGVSIEGIENMLSVAEDCQDFFESVQQEFGDVITEGLALFLFDLYHGSITN